MGTAAALMLAMGVAAGAGAATPAKKAPPPERPRSPHEILASDRTLQARERKVQAMFANARDRDVNGQVVEEEAFAREAWSECRYRACLRAWYDRREQELAVWEGN
jgi:hypothetical protein